VIAQLVERLGAPIGDQTDGLNRLFPTPAAFASATFEGPGISDARVETLRRVSRAVLDGTLDFGAPVEEVTRTLTLQGLSETTAEYIAMRALGDPDAFPIADKATRARAEAWRPWRSYAALHLWHPAEAPRPARRAVHVRKRPVRATRRR
jgi:AraC family transcriptional regulator of adaptative response / DNA-3-methyladenine glycosylase II